MPAPARACARYGVDFVVLNAQPVPTGLLTSWTEADFAPAVSRYRAMGAAFTEVAANGDFAIFRCNGIPYDGIPPDPIPAPVSIGERAVSACAVAVPGQAFEFTGIAVSPARAAPGDSIAITVAYRRDRELDYGRPFLVHVRFDRASVREREYPFDKYVRRFDERAEGHVHRFRADFRPGAGKLDPDRWPGGVPLTETVRTTVPANAAPGDYRVEVRIVRDTLLPNFDWRDLVYNRDHYSGTACTRLIVAGGEDAR
jgi:hypothetical protein